MERIKKTGSGILFGSMIFLLFLVVFEVFIEIPSWLAVAGRMHPMFLHFPIVLLLLSFFTVWVPVSKQEDGVWADILRLAAALSASVTAIMGMLLSMEDGRSGNVLQWHKWGGVGVAVLGFLFYSYHAFFKKYKLPAKLFTIVTTAVIILTGHWGANLTHGEDYVLAPVKSREIKKVAPEEAIIFADVIQPILEKKCVSCHGASSVKGELLLDDLKGVLKGGKSGPLFIPGQPDVSLLIERIHLPMADKKHMPPASKPQLSVAEEAVLLEWIRSGSATEVRLFSLPETDSFRIAATAFLQSDDNKPTAPLYNFDAADEKKVAALNNNYRTIVPLGKNTPALAANFYGRSVYDKKALEEILPLKKQIVELNLSRLPVKDEDIKIITQLENLKKLNLNYTDVSPGVASSLAALKNLEELSLSGTAVTAETVEKLLDMPSLSSLFIWDTKVDSVQLKSLRNRFAKVNIESGYKDDGTEIIALSPPVIRNPPGVFENSIQLELKHPFAGVEIRYTLDGTEPDSVTGTLYTGPVEINRNVTIKARADKPGWYGSNVVQASFIRKGVTPDSVWYAALPESRYTPPSIDNITDGELGSFDNVGNGDWAGFQKNNAAYYVQFNQPTKVQSVLMIAAKNIGRYIFPPEYMEVWGGMEEHKLQLLGKIIPRPAEKGEFSTLLELKVEFEPRELKYIRINAKPLAAVPVWLNDKRPPGWIFVSELIVN
ncbi:MAG: chitobiase/beta-hexosaminidase C-terminal domain-containing protein [Chitinophagaceae bacterium]|nr:chitobiase/beta-hexosaminidase C-terminal domain-containing protein [Chitinophagaceae bacterium]MCW5926128.1 chitobiase/beta-hexosaminidase C-terminal domain-containing protein [Chitinophagaceae bacterium]